MPYFSIIIPTFNRHEMTRTAIESVLSQTFHDYELIVVDDGSTDQTPMLQEEFGARIIYLRQNNNGVSSARNAGIGRARSPYLAFLDSDDRWLPHKLEEHRGYIDRNPGIGIHQCRETWVRHGRRVNPGFRHFKKEGDIFIASLDLCLISPSAVVIHQSLLERHGLFDEQLPACEDYDLWLRITSCEKVGLIDRELMVRYAGHQDQLSQKYWGMDRFRIYAILKLLALHGGTLPAEYRAAARNKALEKLEVLLTGSAKRDKTDTVLRLRSIMEMIKREDYSRTDYLSLLAV